MEISSNIKKFVSALPKYNDLTLAEKKSLLEYLNFYMRGLFESMKDRSEAAINYLFTWMEKGFDQENSELSELLHWASQNIDAKEDLQILRSPFFDKKNNRMYEKYTFSFLNKEYNMSFYKSTDEKSYNSYWIFKDRENSGKLSYENFFPHYTSKEIYSEFGKLKRGKITDAEFRNKFLDYMYYSNLFDIINDEDKFQDNSFTIYTDESGNIITREGEQKLLTSKSQHKKFISPEEKEVSIEDNTSLSKLFTKPVHICINNGLENSILLELGDKILVCGYFEDNVDKTTKFSKKKIEEDLFDFSERLNKKAFKEAKKLDLVMSDKDILLIYLK